MKAFFRAFVCLLVFTAVCHVAAAEETGIDPFAISNSPSGVIRTIAKHLREGRIQDALSLMTKDAADDFVAEYLLLAVQVGYADDGEETEKVWIEFRKKLQTINKKYGLRKDVFPAAYYDDSEVEAAEYFFWIGDATEKLLAAVDKKKQRVAAMQEIYALVQTLTEEQRSEVIYNPFDGKMVRENANDFTGTITLETDSDPEFLLVRKSKGKWLWNGFNETKMEEWRNQPHPLIADIQLTGTTLSGKKFKLADFKGKVVLIDFWGTWCEPCVAKLPAMKKIYAALHEKGFEIIGVASDDQYTLADFLKKNPLPWENIPDPDEKLTGKFEVSALPTTFLCNQKGEHFKSDLFGAKLLDEVIKQLKLDPADFQKLRSELAAEESDFPLADTNHDQQLSGSELTQYLEESLKDDSLPFRKIFNRLDADNNKAISPAEYEKRDEVIRDFMGEDYFLNKVADDLYEEPIDPGVGYAPIRGLNHSVDDRKTMGAVYHRYFDLLDAATDDENWKTVDLTRVPKVADDKAVSVLEAADRANAKKKPATVADLVKATVIIAGGGEEEFFTCGGVIVSESGLALTNYHVAEAMKNSKLMAMNSDGKTYRVVKFVAGHPERDIALIQLEGSGFHSIAIAMHTPNVGDDLVMMHHSENRFYTYDRGYVMRHPTIGDDAWLEVSMDYAPGASGCGIFNKQLQLVGLVSTIQYGFGPELAEPFDLTSDDYGWQGDEFEGDDDDPLLLVKHAVSLMSIRELFEAPRPPAPVADPPLKVGRVVPSNELKPPPVLSSP